MSKIEWTDETWNPVTGCTPISEGCKNCYAKRMAQRLKGRYGYPADDPCRVTYHLDKIMKPYTWKKPRRIFVCSMSDLFHDLVDNMMITRVLYQAIRSPHTFIILTKRPQRVLEFYNSHPFYAKNIDNIWFGVTAENQEQADKRIPILLQIPAAVRFVSFEPLLSRIKAAKYAPKLDWAIIGCESGSGRRQTDVDWIIDLKDTFVMYDKPVFIKQAEIAGKLVAMPKIDGQEWNEYPKG